MSNLQFKENLYVQHVVEKFNKIIWPSNMTHLILHTDEPYFYRLLQYAEIPKNIINLMIKSKPLMNICYIHLDSSKLSTSNVTSVNYKIRFAHHEIIHLYIN